MPQPAPRLPDLKPDAHSTVSVFDQIPEEQKDALQQEFIQAMKDSYVQTPEGLKMQEQGGWITKDISGNYSLDRIKSNAPLTSSPHELYFDFGKTIPPNAIGTFHTHPAPDSPVVASKDDIDIAKKMNLPGLIMGFNSQTNRVDLVYFDKNISYK